MSIPNELQKRQRIAADLKRALQLKEVIDIAESDIVDIASTLNDEKIIKAKDFRELLAVAYEGKVLLEKANKKVADVEAALSEFEIISKIQTN